ncbi:metallophosphoesterase family protein [candidate division WWE3 bacterium]|nr:metallophosphoesterase family protein [candidate division WWE3 bacterium]
MFWRKKKSTKKISGFFRIVRSAFSVVVLTAFILGISYFVREVTRLTEPKLASIFGRAGDVGDVGEVAGGSTAAESESEKKILFRAAIFADVHSDVENLKAALDKSADESVSAIFLLGDETDLGLVDDLQKIKNVMDESGIRYYAIPGDRDLWKTVGTQNFSDVFGDNYHTLTVNDTKFVVLDNSANYSVIPVELFDWFVGEVGDADFVLLSQPLYHPSNDRIMGVVDGEEVPDVRKQARELLEMIRKTDVRAVIAGDHHASSVSTDPKKSGLTHYAVGAITRERNLQTPRFSILIMYEDETFVLTDIII